MNLGLGLNIATTKSGGAIVPALQYQSRVLDDGGTVADGSQSINVYLSSTSVEDPTLLCSCDAYKSALLYSVIVFNDIYDFIQRVTLVEDEAYLIESVHDLRRADLYDRASLVMIGVAGDAEILYSIKA
jgi:hypothetical protein